jgi:hypothetical protein
VSHRGALFHLDVLDQITPVLLTLNESPNIARTLSRLVWAKRIVVVDSGSTDDTVEICNRFSNVDLRKRAFDSHANQWNWAVHETAIDTPWVLALDADYVLSEDFLTELQGIGADANTPQGFFAHFRYCVDGRPLRGSLYPEVMVLFQRTHGRYRQDGHTQRLELNGRAGRLSAYIFHDDRKPLSSWLRSQDRYAALECEHLLAPDSAGLRMQDKLRKLMFVTPFIVPIYCLFVRGLVLDGWAGFHYTMQRTIAEAILSIKLIERRLSAKR